MTIWVALCSYLINYDSYSNPLDPTFNATPRQLAREQRVRNTLTKRQIFLSLAGVLCPNFQHAKGLVVRSGMVLPSTMPIISIPSSEGS